MLTLICLPQSKTSDYRLMESWSQEDQVLEQSCKMSLLQNNLIKRNQDCSCRTRQSATSLCRHHWAMFPNRLKTALSFPSRPDRLCLRHVISLGKDLDNSWHGPAPSFGPSSRISFHRFPQAK